MKKINLEFRAIAKSKCLNAVTSIVSDPRLNGRSICLYFSLLKKINERGICKIPIAIDQATKDIKRLESTGYITFISQNNFLIINFNAV